MRSAGPPGVGYRLSKLLRRHRVFVAAGGVVLVALVGWQAPGRLRERAHRDRGEDALASRVTYTVRATGPRGIEAPAAGHVCSA